MIDVLLKVVFLDIVFSCRGGNNLRLSLLIHAGSGFDFARWDLCIVHIENTLAALRQFDGLGHVAVVVLVIIIDFTVWIVA